MLINDPYWSSVDESEYLRHAQRRYLSIIHHSAWIKLGTELPDLREKVRFIAVSQPGAGNFLHAVPPRKPFQLQSWAMSIAVQRRLGLPLSTHHSTRCIAVGGTASRSTHWGTWR